MDYIDLIYKDYSTIINGPLKILDRQAKGGNIPQKALIERSPCLRGGHRVMKTEDPIGGFKRACEGTVGRKQEEREMKGGT
jgi:hypothetical protein